MAKKVDITNSINLSKKNLLNAANGAALTQDLGALLKSDIDETLKEKTLVDVDLIIDNPFQPRIDINEDSLKNLASSIRSEGLMQPIILQKKNKKYIVIAGHRRLYAHRMINKDKIWATIIDDKFDNNIENHRLLFRKATIENIQRDQLSPLEIALSCQEALNKKLYKTRDEIAIILNKSKSYIAKIMTILKLDEKIIKDLEKNKSIKDIESLYELQKVNNKDRQIELYFLLKNKKISRDDIRSEVKNQKHNKAVETIKYIKNKKYISLNINLLKLDDEKILELDNELKKLILKYK